MGRDAGEGVRESEESLRKGRWRASDAGYKRDILAEGERVYYNRSKNRIWFQSAHSVPRPDRDKKISPKEKMKKEIEQILVFHQNVYRSSSDSFLPSLG
jgi:hypothetical protein